MKESRQKTAMISSTARDLPEHRRMVMDACLRMGFQPIMMNHLAGQDRSASEVSIGMVKDADVYLGIFAHAYGSNPDNDDRSYTEIEFDEAVKLGISVIPFFMNDDYPWPPRLVDKGGKAEKLERLKAKVKKDRIVQWFGSPEDLRGLVIHALGEFEKQNATPEYTAKVPDFHPPNVIPKPPEPYIAHPYSLLQTKDVVGRQVELNLLTDWVTANKHVPADTRIFNLVAIGGMGKSALTWKWFNDIAPNELPFLAGRMWWSFYESDAHWENFIIRALAYVSGQSEKSVRSIKSFEREEQLWQILDRQPFLLVLDGLERILLAYGRMDAARLPDEDLDERTANEISETQDLPSINKSYLEKHKLRQCADVRAGRVLRRLAQLRLSRVLISSRLYPAELQTETGKPVPASFAKFLTGLPDDDALNLWRAFGVTGTREQLLPMFRAFGNYPLILRALAGEVADFRPAPGDFDQWFAENRDFRPAELPLKNARTHVLRFALRGLREKQRYVLSMLAAFRMPATWQTLRDVIVTGSLDYFLVSPKQTEWAQLQPVDTVALDTALAELEDRGLIGWDRGSNRYDLHPIVRIVAWDRTPKEIQTHILEVLQQYFSSTAGHLDRSTLHRLEDITSDIELYCTLMALGRYKNALSVFRRRLNESTLYVFGATRLRVELIEMFFPNGTSSAPFLIAEKSQLLRWLAFAYYLLGEPARSLQMTYENRSTINSTVGFPDEGWRHEFFSAASVGKLRAAELALANDLNSLSYSRGPRVALLSCLPWFMYSFAQRGIVATIKSEAELDREHDERDLPRKVVLVWLIRAQRFLWNQQPDDAIQAINKVAHLISRVERQREPIRIARLYGTALLALGDLGNAAEHLQKALSAARAINLVEEELRTLCQLAELHRQRKEHDISRELLEQIWDPATRGPYPLYHADALNVLAQIERDEENTKAAIAAATKAYMLAWCDGISADGKLCYAYHYGLTNARKHLQEVGAPEPQLPPFDESKFEPMPDVQLNPKDEFWVDPDKLGSRNRRRLSTRRKPKKV